MASEQRSSGRAAAAGGSGDQQNVVDDKLRSRMLAKRGNENVNAENFQAAVALYTEALLLNPADYRFYGNRSLCHAELGNYEQALADAEKIIDLNPQCPGKGYYRKGTALIGMKKYSEAAEAFLRVLEYEDDDTGEIQQQINLCNVYRIMELGFSQSLSQAALTQHKTLDEAVDALLTGRVTENGASEEIENHNYKDDVEEAAPATNDAKLDASNPEGLTSLWVGSIQPAVTKDILQQLFSRYGTVTSIHHLPSKFCAFIHYTNKHEASTAMKNLQGYVCEGQRTGLLIKFPDNPVDHSTTRHTRLKRH